MWEREAEFIELLHSVQQRASRESINALAQMAVEEHRQVRFWALDARALLGLP